MVLLRTLVQKTFFVLVLFQKFIISVSSFTVYFKLEIEIESFKKSKFLDIARILFG